MPINIFLDAEFKEKGDRNRKWERREIENQHSIISIFIYRESRQYLKEAVRLEKDFLTADVYFFVYFNLITKLQENNILDKLKLNKVNAIKILAVTIENLMLIQLRHLEEDNGINRTSLKRLLHQHKSYLHINSFRVFW